MRTRSNGLLPMDEQNRVEALASELHTALGEELAMIGLNVPLDLIRDFTEHVWREARAVPVLRPKP